jgi:hypothetical protein
LIPKVNAKQPLNSSKKRVIISLLELEIISIPATRDRATSFGEVQLFSLVWWRKNDLRQV